MDIVSIIKPLIIGGLAYWVVSLIDLPDPFPRVIRVVVVVAIALYLLGILGGAL